VVRGVIRGPQGPTYGGRGCKKLREGRLRVLKAGLRAGGLDFMNTKSGGDKGNRTNRTGRIRDRVVCCFDAVSGGGPLKKRALTNDLFTPPFLAFIFTSWREGRG